MSLSQDNRTSHLSIDSKMSSCLLGKTGDHMHQVSKPKERKTTKKDFRLPRRKLKEYSRGKLIIHQRMLKEDKEYWTIQTSSMKRKIK